MSTTSLTLGRTAVREPQFEPARLDFAFAARLRQALAQLVPACAQQLAHARAAGPGPAW